MRAERGHYRTNIIQFIKFSLVGVSNTIVGFGAWFVMHRVFGIQYIIANDLSYIPGLLNSFIWNKLWTFESRGNKKLETVLFLAVFVPCFLVQNGALIFLKEIAGLNVIVSQIVSMVVYTVMGYVLNKFVTFNRKIVGKGNQTKDPGTRSAD